MDGPARAAAGTAAADRHAGERAARHRAAAVAATAADRLGHDAVAVVARHDLAGRGVDRSRRDVARVIDRDLARVTAAGAGAAKREESPAGPAAVAAAAADRLRTDRRRIVSGGRDPPGVGDIDRVAIARFASRAAERDETTRISARAAAAADRLREDPARAFAFGFDGPIVGDGHLVAVAARSATPTERDDAAGTRARAAAAADRLRDDRVRKVALGQNASAAADGDVDHARMRPAATAGAEAHHTAGHPCIAATATDRLRKDASSVLTVRLQRAVHRHGDIASGRARATGPAHREDAARTATRTAGTADRLREDSVGAITLSIDFCARLDGHFDRAAALTGATIAAERDRAARDLRRAATAADRLRHHRMAIHAERLRKAVAAQRDAGASAITARSAVGSERHQRAGFARHAA